MKQKIQDQPHVKKVGRLSQYIAKAIHKKAADIYITENYIRHTFIGHEKQIKEVGYTPIEFVEAVVNGFNRIYKGSGQSLLLVIWNGVPKVAAIELNLAFKEEFYEVKTAQIRTKNAVSFKIDKLLWQKK